MHRFSCSLWINESISLSKHCSHLSIASFVSPCLLPCMWVLLPHRTGPKGKNIQKGKSCMRLNILNVLQSILCFCSSCSLFVSEERKGVVLTRCRDNTVFSLFSRLISLGDQTTGSISRSLINPFPLETIKTFPFCLITLRHLTDLLSDTHAEVQRYPPWENSLHLLITPQKGTCLLEYFCQRWANTLY